MKILPLYSLLIVVLLFSCNSIKPAAPDLPVSKLNFIPLPDSKIDVPISIDLQQVLNDAASKIPTTLSGQGNVGPGQYRWMLTRQPFSFTITGDSLYIKDAGNIDVGGYVKNPFNNSWSKVCSCNVTANIGLSMGLNISNNYSLPGDARLTQFDFNACNLNLINFNVTPALKSRAKEGIARAISSLNDQLRKYNFRSLLQPAWNLLNQPIKIADIGYININTSAISMGHPTGSGTLLNFTAGITAKPVFYLADPGKTAFTPLPDLSGGGGGSGFNLNMDIHLDYQNLNELLKKSIVNQKIADGSKSYIIIQDAEVYGSGNEHLLIKVKFTGKQGVVPYHGMLYFTCMPVYDSATGNLYVKDIDFDANTITKLKEGPAIWILSSAMKRYLNSQIHFNISVTVNNVKDKLNQSLNRQVGANVSLSGRVDSLSLQGILPGKDYILVRLKTTGSLAVQIR
ncbi:DUF4403 family protein [Mucilaginibacter sp.]